MPAPRKTSAVVVRDIDWPPLPPLNLGEDRQRALEDWYFKVQQAVNHRVDGLQKRIEEQESG